MSPVTQPGGQEVLDRTLGAGYGTVLANAREQARPLFLVERETFGTDHADVGGRLLEVWRMPTPLTQAVSGHHDPVAADTMAAHLVHQSKSGKLAIVAVLMEAGKEQPLIRTLWNNLPLEKGKAVSPAEVRIDPSLILPKKRTYYTFMGSLTQPPCTEDVLWMVLKQPQQVSPEQLSILRRLYRPNARPVQPAFGRIIKESR